MKGRIGTPHSPRAINGIRVTSFLKQFNNQFKYKIMTEKKTATIIATGKSVRVYRSSQRDTWINSADCTTEYKPKELRFN